MLKLIADIGNTLHKFHIFNGKNLVSTVLTDKTGDNSILEDILRTHKKPEAAIISSVTGGEISLIKALTGICRVIVMAPGIPVPVTNRYGTPETLGSDRLAAATGGYAMFPDDPVLVIDAGTCIKYEIVESGVYSGGIIAPGIHMQASALHTFTGKLPLIKPYPDSYVPLTGNTTESAMMSGIINSTLASMEGIICRYNELFPGLKIILGGGDMNYFVKRLKYSIFAVPNIVALGLNEILDFNENSTEVWFNNSDNSDRFHASEGSVDL